MKCPVGTFLQKIHVRADGCWVRAGRLNLSGYAQFSAGGHVLAHRWVYERWFGPIPAGWQIDHLCRNRVCVNPAHLEAVTASENTRRSDLWESRQTHCLRGHPFAGDNLHIVQGSRRCRACDRLRDRKYYYAHQEQCQARARHRYNDLKRGI